MQSESVSMSDMVVPLSSLLTDMRLYEKDGIYKTLVRVMCELSTIDPYLVTFVVCPLGNVT